MLNEDVQFCPECNEEDPNWQTSAELVSFDDSGFAPSSYSSPFPPDVLEKLQQINQHLQENSTQDQPSEKMPPIERPGSTLFVMMIFLSVCLSFVGFIIGIGYVMSKHKEYQFMGIVMSIISGFFMIIGAIVGLSAMLAFLMY
ncbi:MAG: hypothetical protein FWC91_11995 [Defluviitaleaceae bacterium]|nr:hypothetical protein [Defluviitaleaceae bacterium]